MKGTAMNLEYAIQFLDDKIYWGTKKFEAEKREQAWEIVKEAAQKQLKLPTILQQPLCVTCSECEGNGSDCDDSSKDCFECRGSGKVQVSNTKQ